MRRGGLEFFDQPLKDRGELRIVIIGTSPDELEGLAVAVSGLPVIAPGFEDHPESVVALMHVGKFCDELACGVLRFIELSGADQGGGGIGSGNQFVITAGAEVLVIVQAIIRGLRDGERHVPRLLVLGETTALVFLSAAARAGVVSAWLVHNAPSNFIKKRAAMYLQLLGDRGLDEVLRGLDEDLAAETRQRGCRKVNCRGVLHAARYRRKPRGMPGLKDTACYRESFCCARKNCRTRNTPPSLRFLGPKVYLATVVVLVSVLRCGVTSLRTQQLQQLTGASPRTVQRWRAWWLRQVPLTPFWQVKRAEFTDPAEIEAGLPRSALERFQADGARERLILFLRFLAPLHGRVLSA